MQKPSDTILETAQRGLQNLANAHKDGNFAPYLEMLTEDYVFYMPLGEFRGRNVGRERAAACYAQIAAANPSIQYDPPFRTTVSEQTVVFEFEDAGTIMGQPYQNRIAASFDVRGTKICGYREYFGFIDVDSLATMVKS